MLFVTIATVAGNSCGYRYKIFRIDR